MAELTPTALSKAADISVSYASQVLSGARRPNVRLALHMERLTGGKIKAAEINEDVALVEKHLAAANDDQLPAEAA